MASARQIVKRRKAVTNIRKITKTMQLIATARFQKAYHRATAARPYTEKITEMVQELAAAAQGQVDHPLLRENAEAQDRVLLVLTSNRGLCGGYNASVLRAAVAHLKKGDAQQHKHELHVVGKKGTAYFKFMRRAIQQAITTIDDRPRFEQVEPLAKELIRRYEAGALKSVHVAYMRFISTGRQTPEVIQLLPLSGLQAETPDTNVDESAGKGPGEAAQRKVIYEFSPEPRQLLKVLLPQTVKVRLFQAFVDAAVSEQVARMVAMKAATDAAGDMIKILTRRYNRARQTQITMELLDIVGGSEALV